MTATHLIIGAGNMGGALLAGWLAKGLITPARLAILDPTPGEDASRAISDGATHLLPGAAIPESIRTVMLGIKPQLYTKIKATLASDLNDEALILSIMAGISLENLQTSFPNNPVIRIMPNMPASLSKGMSGYVAAPNVSAAHRDAVEALLGASGAVVQVHSDAQIDSVTAISGSGPAYIFHLCEAMSEAGEKLGLDPIVSAQLARQTIIGAAAQLEQSDKSASDLRQAVTSPGGTTQAALDVLMADPGLRSLLATATQAAKDRAEDLSQ